MTTPTPNKHYFTKFHEDAIVRYCSTTDRREKDQLYEKVIQPAFSELVDKIIYTYKFTQLPNIQNLREECKFWLVTILAKYDPTKGYKAFSYFGAVVKNWFIHKTKKNMKDLISEISYEDSSSHCEIDKKYSTSIPYLENKQHDEFWRDLLVAMKSWDDSQFKPQDLKVIEAINVIFDSRDQLEIFSKKSIYIYLREITGFNSKQITSSLMRIRIAYIEFRDKYKNA